MGKLFGRSLGALFALLVVTIAWRTVREPQSTPAGSGNDPAPGPSTVVAGHRRTPSWRKPVLVALITAAVVLGIGGYAIWPGFGVLDRSREPAGGVLLLHDLLPAEDGGVWGSSAEVDVQIWSTGYPDVSIAELRVSFENPLSEDHWYVVASGDWAVTSDRDLALYCKYGEGRVTEDGIECASQVDNPVMEFRFDQELGNFVGRDLVSDSVAEYDGYDRERVSVVSGSMPQINEYGTSVVEVWLPITTPPIQSVSGDNFFSYPPIASRDTHWSTGPPLAESCVLNSTERWATFALTKSCTPLTNVTVTSSTVDPGIDVGSRTVEYAAPDTVTDDELRWDIAGGFPGARALVQDPFAQADDSRRAFIAAVVLSAAVSFALLFVERLLFHHPRSTSAARSRRAT